MEYTDFENSCQVFMHNFCDSPEHEYYIVTTGKCETYLNSRRNDEIPNDNEAQPEENDGNGNEDITEGNDDVTEGNDVVTEGNDEVTEGNDEVTEGNDEVTEGHDEAVEDNNEETATNDEIEDMETTVTSSKILRQAKAAATTKKAAVTTKKPAAATKKAVATTKKAAATTKKGAATTKKAAATTKKAAATTKKAAVTTKKGVSPIKLKSKTTKFVPLYEVDTAFDDHICPFSCPDTYSPVCVSANRGNGMYFKFFTFVNHCSGDLYYCKNPDEFAPAPDESAEDVNASKLGWSYCGASRYLQFARFSEAISSLGYYGWLAGEQKYSHIMEPFERKPGMG